MSLLKKRGSSSLYVVVKSVMSTKIETQVHLNRFVPRDYQLPIMDAIENKGYKKLVVVMGRRAGKDMVCFNIVVRQALKRVGIYYYLLPTATQARRVMFDGITADGTPILSYIPQELIKSINIQQMKIVLVNSSIIQFCGSENYDSLRGTNPVGIVMSEAAYSHPAAYPALRPILLYNDGFIIFISTPFGSNYFSTIYEIAKQNPDEWFSYFAPVDVTQHISEDQIRAEIESGEISPDLARQEYYCFPAGTQVLTSQGSKSIEEIGINDLVVSHAGRFRKVIKTMSKHYEGDLIEIKSFGSGDDIVCTPEHPIQVFYPSGQTYEWKKASEITLDDLLVFPKMSLGGYPVISLDLCMLLAWYITEGSCFKNGVQFTVGNDQEVEIISKYLNNLGISFSVINTETAINVVVYSVHLSDFFKVNCGSGAANKRIPFSLISGYEELFFKELMLGDGCHGVYDGTEKYVYSTISKTLAYQVQLLAHSLNSGFTAGISKRAARKEVIESRMVNCNESYQVNIYFENKAENKRRGFLRRAKSCVAAQIRSISKKPFGGQVYNLEVQYDNSYLVYGRAVHNCDFSTGAVGSYYATYLNRMELNNQIGDFEWEPNFPVFSSWDLGVRDSTVILMVQLIGRSIHIIDMYHNTSVGLEHYVSVLQNKEYIWGKHVAPHDIQVREFTAGGLSRLEKAAQLGFRFTVAPHISLMDGIECVRTTLPRIYIDQKRCKKLIDALRNYRREYDDKRKVYRPTPLHDENSHFADALRYLCLSLPLLKSNANPVELEKRYNEAIYGSNPTSGFFRDDNQGF